MKTRNGNVELLRFMFANMVVLHHALLPVFKGGWLGVEFFFILTGFFMAKSLEKNKDNTAAEPIAVTVKKSSSDLAKRFLGLFPFVLISSLIGYVVLALNQTFGSTVASAVRQLIRLPYDLFFLQNYGFAAISYIGTIWYLSAMFFAIWLLYPIVRRHYDLYVKYIAPVLSIFLLGFLMRSFGSLAASYNWTRNGLNLGFIRAIAEISWGAFLYEVSCVLSRGKLCKKIKAVLTLTEAACYALIVAYMTIWTAHRNIYDPVIVMIMSVGIVITTSGQSILYGRLDGKLTTFLGKISMVLYLNHAYWLFNIVSLAERFGIQAPEWILKAAGIGLSYLTTLAVYFWGNALQRKMQILMHKLQQCFRPTNEM